jgi:hypothetical protein
MQVLLGKLVKHAVVAALQQREEALGRIRVKCQPIGGNARILASTRIYSFVSGDLAVKTLIGGKFVGHYDGIVGDGDG